ncbi:MAG: hypothetical protein KatS3mg060_0521 [Dehalococcoidia bacterium]|nr:MAG: hypothetical protein KatS3mg060_0521 [Dehalococcoidia bacterium]
MIPPVDVAARAQRAVRRDLPAIASYDYEWARVLLEPTALPAGLVALLALEAAAGALPPTPCLSAWLQLLAAALGRDPVAVQLRESLALAIDARQAIRERRPDSTGAPDGVEAVRVIVGEAWRAARCAELLARRRPNCLLVGG